MEDCTGNEDGNYLSDRDFFDGLDTSSDLCSGTSKDPSSCKVITKESLLAAQTEDLRRVMDMLSLREHHARTLLIYYRWDMEKLFAVLVEKGEACLFAKAGLTMDGNHDPDSQPPPTVMCNICVEDVRGWTGHFVVKINEGQSKRIRCMAHKCYAICDEAIVRNLVSKTHPDLAEKFDRILLESYIEDNKMVKWCPSTPHCGNAIRVEEDELCEVECSCGLQFCFSCLAEAHSPCSCLMWELWTKKCLDANVDWIAVHTVPCPKCHKAVDKNGGCNHMSCICGAYFCWLCGEDLNRNHTGNSCGRYKEDRKKKTNLAKRDLERYKHYHSHYKAHTDSFNHESKLKETLKREVVNLEKKDLSIRDFSWVRNGLYRLLRSRRVLSYSYPFAFMMFGDDLFKDEMTVKDREIKQHLFEDQQQQFEAHVEKLSSFMYERFDQIAEDKVMEIRRQVINLSMITDNLCRKMYECIENDLLGSLQFGIHNIAPYHSKGIEKATKLSVCYPNVNDTQKHHWSNNHTNDATESDLPHSGSSDKRDCSSRKRGRKRKLAVA
ncbi:hypothetical protein Vadar_006199 [Vaccinium darrowii]|uniref:Uncharacterized protein n=1 Tax=Vaccinium darrowii TaxID=229202 RepID=A0ACB7XNX4_9ERIC|nr:hypothetical protein Vadar_006199 [Vaccinium darrowii]